MNYFSDVFSASLAMIWSSSRQSAVVARMNRVHLTLFHCVQPASTETRTSGNDTTTERWFNIKSAFLVRMELWLVVVVTRPPMTKHDSSVATVNSIGRSTMMSLSSHQHLPMPNTATFSQSFWVSLRKLKSFLTEISRPIANLWRACWYFFLATSNWFRFWCVRQIQYCRWQVHINQLNESTCSNDQTVWWRLTIDPCHRHEIAHAR